MESSWAVVCDFGAVACEDKREGRVVVLHATKDHRSTIRNSHRRNSDISSNSDSSSSKGDDIRKISNSPVRWTIERSR
jgi:hypothetical protein